MTSLVLSFLVAVALQGAPEKVVSEEGFSEVPHDVDASNAAGWWEPLALHEGRPVVAFNTPGATAETHGVAIGAQDEDGRWQIVHLKDSYGERRQHGDDRGHDQPTIAVDGSGRVHTFVDHHNDPWRYYVSGEELDLSRLEQRPFGRRTDSITYPIAATAPNGDVFLIARSVIACDHREGLLYHWRNEDASWHFVGSFAREDGAVVYPTDLDIGADGRVHILFEWAQGNTGALRHQGSYLVFDPSDETFSTANGETVTVPVDRSVAGLFYLPLQHGEAFNGRSCSHPGQVEGKGLQGGELSLDADTGNPLVAYRYRTSGSGGLQDYDVYLTRWQDGGWTDPDLVYDGSDTFAALGLTVRGDEARVYFTKAGGEEGLFMARRGDTTDIRRLLAPDPIQRVTAIQTDGPADVIYATAPREISTQEGRLYVGRFDPQTSQPGSSLASGERVQD